MMSPEYEHVLASPRSIAARRNLLRVWQACNEPRAELLRLALDTNNPASRERAAQLVHERGDELAGPIASRVEHFSFGMGLVSGATVTGEQFAAHSVELAALAPLISLMLKDPGRHSLLEAPPVRHLVRLSFLGVGVDDHLATSIAESASLSNVRVMRLTRGTITTRGLNALATSKALPNLISVELTGNPCASEVHQVRESAYFLGQAAAEHWAKARDEQFLSSDSFNPANFFWPPSFDSYAWTE
jgi:hypothetical protein